GIVAMSSFLVAGRADRNERVRLTAPVLLVLSIAALLLSGHQMSNFVRGFHVAMFTVYFFAMLSFAAFACVSRPAADGRATQSLSLVLLSCSFGVCAAFSVGNGLLVLPILLVMTYVRRRELPAGTLLIIGTCAVATMGAYLAAPGDLF